MYICMYVCIWKSHTGSFPNALTEFDQGVKCTDYQKPSSNSLYKADPFVIWDDHNCDSEHLGTKYTPKRRELLSQKFCFASHRNRTKCCVGKLCYNFFPTTLPCVKTCNVMWIWRTVGTATLKKSLSFPVGRGFVVWFNLCYVENLTFN